MWLNELLHDYVTTWRGLKEAFFEKFFPPYKLLQLRDEINNFRELPIEALHETWLQFNMKLKQFPNHKVTDDHLMDTFYISLNETTKPIADTMVGGSFMKHNCTNVATILD